MLICLLGVIIFLCGLPALRYLWLPWLYLFFAIPLPKRTYFQVTNPLRELAARVATAVLRLVPDLDINRSGSIIEYLYKQTTGQIGVADACSGMRSTITLCALGVAVTFMSERAWWQRLIMIAACVPIAVFCNTIRVTVTCALHIFIDPKYATGMYHMMLGLIMLLIAFGIFSGLGWLLNNFFVEDEESETAAT
jgi:exosortase